MKKTNKVNERERKNKDTGMALTLIFLLLVVVGSFDQFLVPAVCSLVITMLCPSLYAPLAKLWFGFSHALGTYVSKIILSVIFFSIVVPVGWLRLKFGRDTMQLKLWKTGQQSVFSERNHTFTSEDLKKPY